MISYFTLAFKKYADFNGRSTRSEYWYFYLCYIIVFAIIWLLSFFEESLSILTILFGLATLIPSLAVAVRRLHDIGKSGWNILWSFLPLIGSIILLVFFCTDSQAGQNEYGPNPKEASTTPPAPTPTIG